MAGGTWRATARDKDICSVYCEVLKVLRVPPGAKGAGAEGAGAKGAKGAGAKGAEGAKGAASAQPRLQVGALLGRGVATGHEHPRRAGLLAKRDRQALQFFAARDQQCDLLARPVRLE